MDRLLELGGRALGWTSHPGAALTLTGLHGADEAATACTATAAFTAAALCTHAAAFTTTAVFSPAAACTVSAVYTAAAF